MTDIVDAHHHIWRQADMPWLSGPIQPRIFGPYQPIQRDYLIDEFLEDLSGTGVVKSVYVQANWPKEKFEDEVAWVSDVADEHGWPHGIVGYADVTVDDVRPQLDRLTKYPLMRGVRMQLHWHENETYRFAARPDLADGSQSPAQHRGAFRLRLELRPSGLRAADDGRRAACRRVPEGDVHPPACRHAGGPLREGPGRHGAPA